MDAGNVMAKGLFATTFLALGLVGCKDSGLPGRNTPQAEAETMEWSYPAYQSAGTHALKVGETEWMVAGPPIRIPENLLVPAGHGGEAAVFALTSDAEPYDRLYVEGPDGWTPLARVPIHSGAEAAAH